MILQLGAIICNHPFCGKRKIRLASVRALAKAPFFLRQSASPSLAPAFTTHNRDEVATPSV